MAFKLHSDLQGAARMDSLKLKTLLAKTRWVAREWEKQFLTPFGKAVRESATWNDPTATEQEFFRLPQRLLSVAVWASDIHRTTKHRQRPLYDDTLATLIEYVKLKTGSFHDRQVSALVCWAIGADSFDENTLRVWRHDHKQALSRARLKLKAH
jgi:hypothetical protein